MELILIILVVFFVFGGGWGHYSGASWGAPVGGLGLILLLVLLYVLFGHGEGLRRW